MKNNYLVQAWLVLTLALLFGAALAGMEVAVADKIKENQLNETMGQIPKLVEAIGAAKTSLEPAPPIDEGRRLLAKLPQRVEYGRAAVCVEGRQAGLLRRLRLGRALALTAKLDRGGSTKHVGCASRQEERPESLDVHRE